jgi:prenylcysteine oxidase/farnesylcysteine lyase
MGLMGLVDALGRVQWPSAHRPQPPPPYERKIAIVGAGPAGVTTAYQLSRLCSQQGIPVHITIYEQSSHIGGRAVHSIVLPTGDGLELGADTFPKTARLLTSAADNLGLETQVFSNDAIDLTGPSGTGSFGVFVPP